MKKVADFLVKSRIAWFILTVALVVASAACIPFVKINYDLTAYLPENSGMKKGLAVLDEQFPATTEQSFKLVFEGLEREEKAVIRSRIAEFSGVKDVEYDLDDPTYNRDEYTLFVVKTDLGEGEETDELISSLEKEFREFTIYTYYARTAKSPVGVMKLVLPIVFAMVVLILFFLCRSFFQPVLIIANIGFAIIINMGTNILLGSVSDITFSISAVMQLILSIDYSVILLNEYAAEREKNTDKSQAMKNALHHGAKSILGSAITTVIGLIALIFMSFRLGQDMGVVLAKGVLVSCLCVFTGLPCLVLWSDSILQKTDKKRLLSKIVKPGATGNSNRLYGGLGRLYYALRYPLIGIAIVLFVATCFLQLGAKINYSENSLEVASTAFPEENVVLVYANEDEKNISDVIGYLEECEGVRAVIGYANTLGREMDFAELAESFDIPGDISGAFYYVYENGFVSGKMTVKQFIDFVGSEAVLDNPILAEIQTDEIKNALRDFSVTIDYIASGREFTAAEIAEYFDIDEVSVKALFLGKLKKKMTLPDFISLLLRYPDKVPPDRQAELGKFKEICDAVVSNKPLNSAEMAELLPVSSDYVNPTTVKLVYVLKAAEKADLENVKIPLYDVVGFLYETGTREEFSALIDDGMMNDLVGWKNLAEEGKNNLVGKDYSRLIITLDYPCESEELYSFYREAEGKIGEVLDKDAYFVGESAMSFELAEKFPMEYLIISVLIAAIVFVIVCFTLKKVSFAAAIVGLIQSAVFFMMSYMAISHSPIHYVAVIIVQCVLMGAMVDYGIIMTVGFQRAKEGTEYKQALGTAVAGSARVVLISALTVIAASFTLGFTIKGAVGSILISLGIGTVAATVLMFTVMPAFLAVFGKLSRKKG